MSALNTWIAPDRIVVVTDTLGMFASTGRPFGFVAKAHVLPHLGMIVGGTGSFELTAWWRDHLEAGTAARRFDDSHAEAETLLPMLWRRAGAPASTVYGFGWSETADRFQGYRYSSASAFQPERLADGFDIKPMLEDPEPLLARAPFRSSEDLVAMLHVQLAEDRRRPPSGSPLTIAEDGSFSGRCGIGGEPVVFTLSRSGSHVAVSATREAPLARCDDDAREVAAMGHLGAPMMSARMAERAAAEPE